MVIPVYNGADYLHLAIDSALAQTSPAHEVVVLDDASTDATPGVIEPYAASGKVRADRLALRKPAPGAWNEAVRRATGDYVCVLAHDDLLDATFLEEIAALLRADPAIDVAITSHRFIDSEGTYQRTHEISVPGVSLPGVVPTRQYLDYFTRHGQFFLPTATVFRRSLFERLGGFDERIKVAYDWEFFLRVAAAARIYIVNKPLMSYRIHATQSIVGHTRSDNGDSDVIFEKLPQITSDWTDDQRRWITSEMCAFVRRFVTHRLFDRKTPPEDVLACRRAVVSKLSGWRTSGSPLAGFVQVKPTNWRQRFAWWASGSAGRVRLLRKLRAG